MNDTETAQMKTMIKETVNEVLDERRSKNLTDLDHELHHLWVARQIKSHRRIREITKEVAVRWGITAAIIALGYGVIEIVRLKLGGISG